MIKHRISERLKVLLNYIEKGDRVADIGTDHAFIPIYLARHEIAPLVIACDVNKKPLEIAKNNVQSYNLLSRIQLRLGNGLEPLKPGEVDTVVIAGMGGLTIIQILSASPQVLNTVKKLILQPMSDEADLRNWLIDHGWRFVDESMLWEEGHFYQAIICEKGVEKQYSEVVLEIGPKIIEKNSPLLSSYLKKMQEKYETILNGLQKTDRIALDGKKAKVEENLCLLEELIHRCK